MPRFWCLRILVAVASSVARLATAGPATSDDLVIGELVDRSAIGVEASRDFSAGAKIWFDHVNKQGGIGGLHLVVRTRDGDGAPSASLAAARALIDEDRADVLFGVMGDAPAAAIVDSGLLDKANVVMFGPATGRWNIAPTANVRLLRASYDAEIERAIASYRQLGLTKFAIVQSDSATGQQIAEAAKRQLANATVSIFVVHESRGIDAATVAALRNDAPQALIVAADSITTANIVRAYAPADQGVVVIGTSAVNPRTVADLAGPQARTVVISQIVPDPAAGTLAVTREHLKLMDLYLAEPPNQQTLAGFIAAKALTESLRGLPHPVSRATVSEVLRKTRHVDVGGFELELTATTPASRYVDLTLLRADGTLLH